MCPWHSFVTIGGSRAGSQAPYGVLAGCKAAAPVESGSSLRPELAVGALPVDVTAVSAALCLHSKWVPPDSWVCYFQVWRTYFYALL